MLLFPSSTTMCVRGFFKQNLIESHQQASLVLETLDASMQILLADIAIHEIDWDNVILLWINMRDQRINLIK